MIMEPPFFVNALLADCVRLTVKLTLPGAVGNGLVHEQNDPETATMANKNNLKIVLLIFNITTFKPI
jgi:hypothetical protein